MMVIITRTNFAPTKLSWFSIKNKEKESQLTIYNGMAREKHANEIKNSTSLPSKISFTISDFSLPVEFFHIWRLSRPTFRYFRQTKKKKEIGVPRSCTRKMCLVASGEDKTGKKIFTDKTMNPRESFCVGVFELKLVKSRKRKCEVK